MTRATFSPPQPPEQPVARDRPLTEDHLKTPEQLQSFLAAQAPFDLVVGINSRDVATTIIHVLNVVCTGLQHGFTGYRSLVVVVDGGSEDGTVDLARFYPAPDGITKIVVPQHDGPGKGRGVELLMRIARQADARAIACVDGDLVSIQPVWLESLLRPVLYGLTDLVVPYYLRDKWDSVITNHLCYPLTAALYGTAMRQPIGGEYAFSPTFIKHCLAKGLPPHFGIDIHLSTTALAEHFRVQEAPLGIKVHASTTGYVDPAASLSRMHTEVVGTLFGLARRYEDHWSQADGDGTVLLSEHVLPYFGRMPPPVRIDQDRLLSIFRSGVERHQDVLRRVLPRDLHRTLDADLDEGLPAEDWARLVYAVAAWYVASHEEEVERDVESVLHALGALNMGRFLAFVRETADLGLEASYQLVRDQAEVFARLRPEFLARVQELRRKRSVLEAQARADRRKRHDA